ncbi:MAG: C4-type zinc ribbon domain-containing protein [Armatimonadota bacterium]
MAAEPTSKTLRDDLLALLAVQVIDTKIDRAKAAIAALDTGSKTAAAFNAQKATSEALRTAANKAQTDQKDAEMRLATVETKSAQVNKSMFSGTVTGSRELENLQRELEMLGRQKDDAEMKVLEAMEASGEAVTSADSAEQTLASLADQYRRTRAAYKERHAELTAEIAAEETLRAAAAKAVSAPLLARYEAIRPKKNGVGATPLEADGVSCGGCHTQLNTTLVADVRAAQSMQTCEYCGRILIPEPIPH